MGSINKSNRKPSLSQTYKDKRKKWAEGNVETDFSKVVFIEKPMQGHAGWT